MKWLLMFAQLSFRSTSFDISSMVLFMFFAFAVYCCVVVVSDSECCGVDVSFVDGHTWTCKEYIIHGVVAVAVVDVAVVVAAVAVVAVVAVVAAVAIVAVVAVVAVVVYVAVAVAVAFAVVVHGCYISCCS